MDKIVLSAFADEFQKIASKDNFVKEALLDTALAAYLGKRKYEEAGLDPAEGALHGGAGWMGGSALGSALGGGLGALGGGGAGALIGALGHSPESVLAGAQLGALLGGSAGGLGGAGLGGYKGYKYLTEKAEKKDRKLCSH